MCREALRSLSLTPFHSMTSVYFSVDEEAEHTERMDFTDEGEQ